MLVYGEANKNAIILSFIFTKSFSKFGFRFSYTEARYQRRGLGGRTEESQGEWNSGTMETTTARWTGIEPRTQETKSDMLTTILQRRSLWKVKISGGISYIDDD